MTYHHTLHFIIEDGALSLSELNLIASMYPERSGYAVTTSSRWGGPHADGIYDSVAVVIFMNQLLQGIGSDAYNFVKNSIIDLYHKISADDGRPRTKALALAIQSEEHPVDFYFTFPKGLPQVELLLRYNSIEREYEVNLKAKLEERAREASGGPFMGQDRLRVDLCLDPGSGDWTPC